MAFGQASQVSILALDLRHLIHHFVALFIVIYKMGSTAYGSCGD